MKRDILRDGEILLVELRELQSYHWTKAYARLSEVQLLNRDHPEQGMFIAESPKVIERALDSGYALKSSFRFTYSQ